MIEIKKPLILNGGEPEEIGLNQAVPLAAELVAGGADVKVFEVFVNNDNNLWSVNYSGEFEEVYSVLPVIKSPPDILFNQIALVDSWNHIAASGSIFSVNLLAQALGIVGTTVNLLTGGGILGGVEELAPEFRKVYVTVIGKRSLTPAEPVQ